MKLSVNKKSIIISVSLLAVAGVFLLVNPVSAGGFDWVYQIFGGIFTVLISALGLILILVIRGLMLIASYQNFIGSPAVVQGWVIVRDVCNMFFVIVLLIIAFGTILHLENYSYKKWLPKLILMAVLINFSKTICGLLIDVSQVIMLSFVNAFKDVGSANLLDILGISDILTFAKSTDTKMEFWTVIGAYILGLLYVIISIVVIAAMTAMLAVRLVMIWIYVVLSPLAYLLSAFPGGQKYASQWWSQFTQNLIVGPVLAFFIWLSFAALQQDTSKISVTAEDQAQVDQEEAYYVGQKPASSTAELGTKASTPEALINFVVAIGMLIGGMKIAQEVGGAAAGVAGKVSAGGFKFAKKLGKGTASLAKAPVNWGVDKLHEKKGIDLNLKRVVSGIQAKRKENKIEQYAKGQVVAGRAMEEGNWAHGMLAMTGNPGDAWDQMSTWKGFKKRMKGGKALTRERNQYISQKDQAESQETEAKYQEEFISADRTKRKTMLDDSLRDNQAARDGKDAAKSRIIDLSDQIADEEKKGGKKDKQKIKGLQSDKEKEEKAYQSFSDQERTTSERTRFTGNNQATVFTDDEKNETGRKVKAAQDKVKETQEKVDAEIPDYNFEARAAEQSAVSAKMGKIKDITDSSELLRILKNAIASHDKTMVKAISLKMTKDGNDNEYLQPLAGRTDHIGLKDLMKQFSQKGSKNYAGFSEQEAFGLGSQIAEINKATNHWAATGAYEMENGRWRETTTKEHHQVRDIESGKQQLQASIRNNNRLAYGYHDEKGKFHIDAGGLIKIMGIDTADGHKNMNTMNENAAKYLYDAIKEDKELEIKFSNKNASDSKSFLDMLEMRLGSLKDGDFDSKYDEVKKYA